ncbi:hypothetical protein V1264_007514 [Littorina saxatilis]|uniref:Uncharacterized protein n=1 Tax=Littorina saxatilis TaxID=31220 RepID=A0AAN9AUZ9_9CAEN
MCETRCSHLKCGTSRKELMTICQGQITTVRDGTEDSSQTLERITPTSGSSWKFSEERKQLTEQRLLNTSLVILHHPGKRRKYKDSNERILRLVRSYDNRNLDSYLLGIAHNVFF